MANAVVMSDLTEMAPVDGKFPRRQRILNVLSDPWLWRDAAQLPRQDMSDGGRPRHYPRWTWVLFDTLINEFGSATAVALELRDPRIWADIQQAGQDHFPDDPSEWAPDAPIPRHVYAYAKKRYLNVPEFIEESNSLLKPTGAEVAELIGACVVEERPSWTHPKMENTVRADGKVVTARTRKPRLDRETGEIRPRSEPDLEPYVTGGGHPATGVGFILVVARGPVRNERVIFDVTDSPRRGGEAAHALVALERTLPHLPGAQVVLYDGAFRGKHRRRIFELGKIPITPPRNRDSKRRERDFRTATAVFPDGRRQTVRLHLVDGAPHLKELAEDGSVLLTRLPRVKTIGPQGPRGRSYSEFRLPDGSIVRLRATSDEEDGKRGFNREEHFHPFAPGDPDYERLYKGRNDTESGHRVLDDSMLRERAHSIGRPAIRYNLITWAAYQNAQARALALWRLSAEQARAA